MPTHANSAQAPLAPAAQSSVAIAVLLAASSLTVMAGATIAPALPAMARHFEQRAIELGGTPADGSNIEFLIRLALTGPGLFTAIVSLLAGPIIDRFGRVPVLLAGLVLYLLAGTSGLYVQNLTHLLVGRAVLGVAVALVMVATTTLIGDLFAGPARQRFTGLQSACMSFGGVGFLVLGGVLADLSWRAPFVIYFAAAAVLLGVLVAAKGMRPLVVQAPTGKSSEKDALGAPLATVMLILLLGFVGMALFYMIPTHLPFLLNEMGIEKRSLAGLAIAVNGLVAGVVAMNFGRLRARLSPAGLAAAMFLAMAAGYGLFFAAKSYPVILAGAVVTGLGQGLMLPNAMSWMQAVAPPASRARLSGFLVAAVFLGQFLSPFLSKPVGDRLGLAGEFGAAALLMLAIAGLFVFGAARKRRASA